ncbi:MAG: phosphatidate cytidylyltransferase [Thermoleophilaceae bacterium]|nr:phosphatidate cytidylyltransferase [Thermoleophilaceae bacterium]
MEGSLRGRRRPPERSGREPRRRRGERSPRSETWARVAVAVPAAVGAVLIVYWGGAVFVVAIALLGLVALHELFGLMEALRPPRLAGFLTLIALVVAAALGGTWWVLLAVVASIPLTFGLALLRPGRDGVTFAMAGTLLGALWVGLALAHAIFLRDLPDGGGLMLDVLIGTFLGDVAAYFGGRAWGRRELAPLISPSKTVEGAVAGVIGGTLALFLFAVAYQDFFDGRELDALVIGLCVALATPIGDLFESLVKRDLGTKDTGRFFGVHGGVLDRLDAVFFTVVAGYYAAVAVGF